MLPPGEDGATILPRFERWASVGVLLAFLVLWEACSRLDLVPSAFFPPPSVVSRHLVALLGEASLWRDLWATVERVLGGLLIGGLPGLAVGLAMGHSRRLRRVLDPLVAAAHPLPKVALLPLLLVVFGIGNASKIAMASIGAFFPLLINAAAGVRQLSPIHFEVAHNYGASTLQVWRRVILPGSLPAVLPGVRLAFNVAMVLTVATELAAAQDGLGQRIWRSWQTFRVEELYACLVVIAAVGIAFNALLQLVTDRMIPWYREREL